MAENDLVDKHPILQVIDEKTAFRSADTLRDLSRSAPALGPLDPTHRLDIFLKFPSLLMYAILF